MSLGIPESAIIGETAEITLGRVNRIFGFASRMFVTSSASQLR